jgi:hypothetical protein
MSLRSPSGLCARSAMLKQTFQSAQVDQAIFLEAAEQNSCSIFLICLPSIAVC